LKVVGQGQGHIKVRCEIFGNHIS